MSSENVVTLTIELPVASVSTINSGISKKLSKEDKRAIADLDTHAGWRVLKGFGAKYVQGHVVDKVLLCESDEEKTVSYARGMFHGMQLVFRLVDDVKREFVDKDKKR